MSNNYAYVALLDVLSYKNKLQADNNSAKEDFKNSLMSALSPTLNSINQSIFNIRAISDTIIISCNSHDKIEEFIKILARIFIDFLKQKLFIRGGVSYGRHFYNNNLTYSNAIVTAHELENQQAVYPRILIDKNIIEMHAVGNAFQTKIIGRDYFAKQNGKYFINIIKFIDSWDELYYLAKETYLSDKAELDRSESAFSKHQWFENYLFSQSKFDPSCTVAEFI